MNKKRQRKAAKKQAKPEPQQLQLYNMPIVLNPRGQLAKDLEGAIKRAGWLALVCSHWLAFHGHDSRIARADEPTYDLPKKGIYEHAARFNKARKECGAWDLNRPKSPSYKYKVYANGEGKWVRSNRPLTDQTTIPVAEPSWAARWDWATIFDHWYSGGLDRTIEQMRGNLPEANLAAIDKELAK